MDVPPISAYMGPILHVLIERGGRATVDEVNEGVAARLELTDEQRSRPHGKGDRRSEFAYRTAWARTKLKKDGYLEADGRGACKITEAGRAKILADVDAISTTKTASEGT